MQDALTMKSRVEDALTASVKAVASADCRARALFASSNEASAHSAMPCAVRLVNHDEFLIHLVANNFQGSACAFLLRLHPRRKLVANCNMQPAVEDPSSSCDLARRAWAGTSM